MHTDTKIDRTTRNGRVARYSPAFGRAAASHNPASVHDDGTRGVETVVADDYLLARTTYARKGA